MIECLAPCRRSPRGGFTLVEVIAVIVLLGVLGGVTSSLILSATAGFVDSSVRMQLHGEASVALDRLVREWREIDADPVAGAPSPHITEASATVLEWGDDSRLRLDGADLLLAADGAAERLLCNAVSEFSIAYFDESNRPLLVGASVPPADRPRIRRLALRLALTRQGLTESLQTRVFVRCAMMGESP